MTPGPRGGALTAGIQSGMMARDEDAQLARPAPSSRLLDEIPFMSLGVPTTLLSCFQLTFSMLPAYNIIVEVLSVVVVYWFWVFEMSRPSNSSSVQQ